MFSLQKRSVCSVSSQMLDSKDVNNAKCLLGHQTRPETQATPSIPPIEFNNYTIQTVYIIITSSSFQTYTKKCTDISYQLKKTIVINTFNPSNEPFTPNTSLLLTLRSPPRPSRLRSFVLAERVRPRGPREKGGEVLLVGPDARRGVLLGRVIRKVWEFLGMQQMTWFCLR